MSASESVPSPPAASFVARRAGRGVDNRRLLTFVLAGGAAKDKRPRSARQVSLNSFLKTRYFSFSLVGPVEGDEFVIDFARSLARSLGR